MSIVHNHSIHEWIEDLMAEGFTREEAITRAREELETRKTTQERGSIEYAEQQLVNPLRNR